MGHLENLTFREITRPKQYCRYVDDIFISVNDEKQILQIKNKFEENSILKFTIELEKNKILNFLDVTLNNSKDKYETYVYTKLTNDGSCLSFNSICPNRYKIGVIKTLLHRAYLICSSWFTLNNEITRIKQLLVNNNYPLYLIEKSFIHF